MGNGLPERPYTQSIRKSNAMKTHSIHQRFVFLCVYALHKSMCILLPIWELIELVPRDVVNGDIRNYILQGLLGGQALPDKS